MADQMSSENGAFVLDALKFTSPCSAPTRSWTIESDIEERRLAFPGFDGPNSGRIQRWFRMSRKSYSPTFDPTVFLSLAAQRGRGSPRRLRQGRRTGPQVAYKAKNGARRSSLRASAAPGKGGEDDPELRCARVHILRRKAARAWRPPSGRAARRRARTSSPGRGPSGPSARRVS